MQPTEPIVKICGVRSLEQALACVEAGANAIGINLWPSSKRAVSLALAKTIAMGLAQRAPHVLRVAVLVNPEAALVREVRHLQLVPQLHGDEEPGRFVPAWKALRLHTEADLAKLDLYGEPDYPFVVLDAPADPNGPVETRYGGTGKRAPLELARKAAHNRKVILAGGLTEHNVQEAIALCRPCGVDVASGVESRDRPFDKDLGKVKAFVQAARAAFGTSS